MIKLSREIRFALVPPDQINERMAANTWSGWPSSNQIVPHLVLRCVVQGIPDPQTGYLCNIKLIDELLRQIVTRRLIVNQDRSMTAESMVRTIYLEARDNFASQRGSPAVEVISLTLALSPFLSYTIKSAESGMVQLTQQFEFSAAHRLHCDELSSAENREVFGKCNNPEGHGHNYVFEVTVARDLKSGANDKKADDQIIPLETFEATVKRLIVDRLDHKHLNRDVDYFSDVNPTVENIAVAIYSWLDGEFGAATLKKIRVYETPKTWAEFTG